MRNCILCGELTSGSVGAAGYKWSMICQGCKDLEDKALSESLMIQCKVFGSLFANGGVK